MEIDTERCKGCELCVGACPQKVLRMAAQFNRQGLPFSEIHDADRCTACMSCAIICPDTAIRVLKLAEE